MTEDRIRPIILCHGKSMLTRVLAEVALMTSLRETVLVADASEPRVTVDELSRIWDEVVLTEPEQVLHIRANDLEIPTIRCVEPPVLRTYETNSKPDRHSGAARIKRQAKKRRRK